MHSLLSCIFALFIIASNGPLALAGEKDWNTRYDRFFSDPSVKVDIQTLEDGTVKRTLTLPGEILVEQRRRDGKVSTFTTDRSGLGAVLCAKEILFTVKTAIDHCEALKNPKLSKRFGEALSKINHFIAANWPRPVTLDEIMRNDKKRVSDLVHSERNLCKGDEAYTMAQMVEGYEQMPEKTFMDEIDKMLSVPRLPVMAPCL